MTGWARFRCRHRASSECRLIEAAGRAVGAHEVDRDAAPARRGWRPRLGRACRRVSPEAPVPTPQGAMERPSTCPELMVRMLLGALCTASAPSAAAVRGGRSEPRAPVVLRLGLDGRGPRDVHEGPHNRPKRQRAHARGARLRGASVRARGGALPRGGAGLGRTRRGRWLGGAGARRPPPVRRGRRGAAPRGRLARCASTLPIWTATRPRSTGAPLSTQARVADRSRCGPDSAKHAGALRLRPPTR